MKKVILFFSFASMTFAFAGDIIKVGVSNLSTATAFNNARKIARTTSDQFVVVYEDVVDGQNAIFYNYSADGQTWMEAKFIAYGSTPALAVSNENLFYLAYTKSNKNLLRLMVFSFDELADLNSAKDIDIYYPGFEHTVPTLDVGPRFVHLAFQSTEHDAAVSTIRWGLFHHDLEPATSIFTVNEPTTNAMRPTLQTDLEYASDYVNLFWTEEIDSVTHIHHMSINADTIYALQPASQDLFDFMLKSHAHINDNFAQFSGCTNPSFSVRAEPFGGAPQQFANRIIMGCDNLVKKQFNLFSLDYETDVQSIDIRGGYRQSSETPAWPSVDDIILNPRSCAIVWENAGSIFYGQSLYADIVTDPIVTVSGAGEAHFPSVCYKTFRSDFFDVVWTQKADTAFNILYTRMDKHYWFDPIIIDVDSIVTGTYGHSFAQSIRVSGGINNRLNLELVGEPLPDSLTFQQNMTNEFEWSIQGMPKTSGTFPITMRATDIGDDAGLTIDKSVSINIINTKPMISVLPSVTQEWRRNEPVEYKINIIDVEGNAFDWHVSNLPEGLIVDKDSFIITGTGTLPAGEELPYETTFTLDSDDGDKQDTVVVTYKLLHETIVTGDDNDNLPKDLTLHTAYPNPFNPATTVKLDVPTHQHIIVEVFDLRGRLITSLHDGELDAGYHSFTFDGASISSGSYFIRMQSGDEIQTQKCVLLK